MLLFWREDYFPEASGTDDAGAAIWVNCFGLHRKMSSSKQCILIEDKLDIFLAVQNSSIGDLVTHSVTDSLRTLLLDRNRATLETCDL